MASFIGDLVVRVTASTSGLEKGLSKVESMIQRTTSVVKNAMAFMMKSILGLGVAAGGASIAFLKLSADAESMTTQFKVLTGSAKNAAALMKDIQKFAKETPYGQMEIGDAARQLLAFGGSQKRVIDELRVLGDIASGTRTPIGELAELYGKARVQGRLYMQDVNQFSGRGINIRDSLARQFGDVNKAVEEGKVGFYELQVALDELAQTKFANMMVEQSATLNGMWSTFLDNLTMIGQQFGDVLAPYVKGLLGQMSTFLENFQKMNDKFAFLKSLLSALYEWAVGAIKYKIDDVFAYLLEVGKPVMAALGEAMRAAVDPFFEQTPGRIGKKGEVTPGQDQFGRASQRLNNLLSPMFKAEETVGTFAGVPGIKGVRGPGSTLVDPATAAKNSGAGKLFGLGSSIGDALAEPFAAMKQAGLNKLTSLGVTAGALAGIGDRWLMNGGGGKARDAQSPAALRKGSQEAYSALVQASMRGKDPVVAATEKQTSELKKPLTEMVDAVKANGIAIIGDFLGG